MLLFSHPVTSNSLRPHGLQHTRPPFPSPSPGICWRSSSLHQWYHPAISSSDAFFSFCLQSFPESGTFPMSLLFTSDDQNNGVSASASVLTVNIQGCSSLRLTGLISLVSKGHQESSPAPQFKGIRSLALCLLCGPALTSICDLGKTVALSIGPLSAEWCLCFSTHSLGLSWLSCQEAIVLWFHGCVIILVLQIGNLAMTYKSSKCRLPNCRFNLANSIIIWSTTCLHSHLLVIGVETI